jgi:hypothetical protein
MEMLPGDMSPRPRHFRDFPFLPESLFADETSGGFAIIALMTLSLVSDIFGPTISCGL